MKNKEKPEKKKTHRAAPKYYRFGICGLTSSGKTCFLAALAMARIANRNGYTMKFLGCEKGSSDALRKGWEAINNATKAIESGTVPKATPYDTDLTLRFEVSDGKSRQSYVELTDYSGELLEPEKSASDLTSILRDDLTKTDGFLVVAEYPEKGLIDADLAEPLDKLGTAFAGIGNNKKDDAIQTPIALLIDKCDRSNIDLEAEDASELAHQELARFLSDPTSPHSGLMNQLKAASPEKTKPFPVSAFGPSMTNSDSKNGLAEERPCVFKPQLKSFGLEDPFIWLIHERDRSDADFFTNKVK